MTLGQGWTFVSKTSTSGGLVRDESPLEPPPLPRAWHCLRCLSELEQPIADTRQKVGGVSLSEGGNVASLISDRLRSSTGKASGC